jgi:hypothetical protein
MEHFPSKPDPFRILDALISKLVSFSPVLGEAGVEAGSVESQRTVARGAAELRPWPLTMGPGQARPA